MAVMIFFFVAIVLLALVFKRNSPLYREAIREKEAVFLDCDMFAKFRELMDDCTMNKQKWQEWLPVFEAADAEVRSKCNLPLGRNAELIKRVLSDDELQSI